MSDCLTIRRPDHRLCNPATSRQGCRRRREVRTDDRAGQDSTMQRPDQPLPWGRRYAMVGRATSASTTGSTPSWTSTTSRTAARTVRSGTRTGRGDRERRRPGRRDRAAAGLARHGLRDEPRPGDRRRHSAGDRVVMSHMRYAAAAPRGRDLAPLVRPRRFRAVRTSGAAASARTSRPVTRSRTPVGWSSATARAPRSSRSSTWRPSSTCRSLGVCGSPTRACTTSTSAFCPLDERRAIVCPAAFDAAERASPARPGAGAARDHRGRRR